MTGAPEDAGRRAHYRDFYEPGTGPVALVHGNCQAEALRVLLAPALPDLQAVRVPPVHELTASDLPHLDALLRRARLLVAQPVRPGYRDLPLGTAEVAARCAAEVVVVPAVRISTVHPFQAIVRDPEDPSRPPPVVAYHDLRTLAVAAGARPRRVAAQALLDVGQAAVDELARRERHTDVGVSDVVAGLGTAATWTINHPGNAVLQVLVTRVLARLGRVGVVTDPGRDLLGSVKAPLEEQVLSARGLTDTPREHWLVEGRQISDEEVRAAQMSWYAAHPRVVAAGLARHGATLQRLGLL